jgi:hypothetical protein
LQSEIVVQALRLEREILVQALEVGERDCFPGLEVGEIQVQQYQQIWNKRAIFKEKQWSIQY